MFSNLHKKIQNNSKKKMCEKIPLVFRIQNDQCPLYARYCPMDDRIQIGSYRSYNARINSIMPLNASSMGFVERFACANARNGTDVVPYKNFLILNFSAKNHQTPLFNS